MDDKDFARVTEVKDFARVTEVMGRLQGEANAQFIALFIATWAALAHKEAFQESTIQKILDQAEAHISTEGSTNVIAHLRNSLFPPH